MRVGHGYDVHAFVEGRPLVLGGVTIDHSHGLDGHSDADVLIHAVCDAVLGALALGDIGQHFPDSDLKFKGADSRVLLRAVVEMMQARGYALGNLDVTVVAQAPKLAPYLDTMRSHLCADFHSTAESINIKATTTEQLGFCGRKEGIAAHAVVLLLNQ